MNAEQFHDALSQLPSDLVAETDKLRRTPRTAVIPWKRWAALAACLVLVLSSGLVFSKKILPALGGGAMEKIAYDEFSAECVPQEPAAVYVPTEAATDTSNSLREEPMMDAEEALTPTGYPADGSYFIDLDAARSILTCPVRDSSRQTTVISNAADLETYLQNWKGYSDLYVLEDACAAFDGSWFEAYDLLLIPVDTEKSELVPTIDSITFWPDSWELVICFNRMPDDNAPDPACWHILLPVQKGLLPDGIDITLSFP